MTSEPGIRRKHVLIFLVIVEAIGIAIVNCFFILVAGWRLSTFLASIAGGSAFSLSSG
jgi:hypothetical protein